MRDAPEWFRELELAKRGADIVGLIEKWERQKKRGKRIIRARAPDFFPLLGPAAQVDRSEWPQGSCRRRKAMDTTGCS